MKSRKKQICILIAGVVSICCVISLISTVTGVLGAVRSGEPIPTGMVMLTLVTAFCTAVIWKGVRDMEE